MDAKRQWFVEAGLLGLACVASPLLLAFFQPQSSLAGWPAPVVLASGVNLAAWSWVLLRSRNLLAKRSFEPAGATGERKATRPPQRPGEELERLRTQAAVQLLELFQRKGRLVDFLEEELDSYEDAQIGAAVRSVHAGCREVLEEVFALAPLRQEEEGAQVEVASGYDAREVRLAGRITGKPPFRGILRHRGWKVLRVELPRLSQERRDSAIVAPAEIDIEAP